PAMAELGAHRFYGDHQGHGLPGVQAVDPVPAELPGWGLELGAYPGKDAARQVVASAKVTLGSSARPGTPMALARKGTRSYSPLLGGLSERQARAPSLLLPSRGTD